jgi:hypothetical protein
MGRWLRRTAEDRYVFRFWLGKCIFMSQGGEEDDDTHRKFLTTDQRARPGKLLPDRDPPPAEEPWQVLLVRADPAPNSGESGR